MSFDKMAQNILINSKKACSLRSPPNAVAAASAAYKTSASASTTMMDVIRDCSPTRPKLTKVSERQPKLILDQINQLRRATELCDVVLVVGSSRIQAHKIILSASSPYFRAMFTGEMAEAKQTEVMIKDIDETAMEMLIDFCYTSKITVDEKIVQTLLPAACLLQLQEVQDYCSEFLRSQLDPTNCLGIRAFADTHSCRELLLLADKYMRNNFPEVIESEEFFLLPVQQLIEIISNDELNVRNEEQVYQAVMNWIRYNIDERRQYLAELMMHVRLPLVDTKFLVKFICSEPLLKQDPTCRDLLDEAKDYHLLPQERALMQGPRTKPRRALLNARELVFAVGGWCSGDAISSVEMFDPLGTSNDWRLVTPMSKRRCGVGVAVLNQQLYAIGGHDGVSYLNTVERYDPITNQWFMDVAPTTSCRTSVGVAVLDNYLYAIGGQDGVSCLSYVEKYDFKVNRWTRVASMQTKRLGVAVAVLGSYLYAIGGSDGASPLNTVERYDPRANKWEKVASMSTPRKHLGCAVYRDHIYAVGGRDDASELNSVERYNPEANEWSKVVSMKSRRSGVGLAVVNGLLMAIGGFDGSNYLKTIETYDAELDSWKPSGTMIYRRLGGGVGVIQLENTNSVLFKPPAASPNDVVSTTTTNSSGATGINSRAANNLVHPLANPPNRNQMAQANYHQPAILSPTPLLATNLGAYSHHQPTPSSATYAYDGNLPSLIANVPQPPPHNNVLISSISSTLATTTTPTTPTSSLLSSSSSSNLVGSIIDHHHHDLYSQSNTNNNNLSNTSLNNSSLASNAGATGGNSSPTASSASASMSNMKLLDL